MTDEARASQLEHALVSVRERVDSAARSVDRDPLDVTLVVVTKTWPISDIRSLHALGVRDFGENRHQEAEQKAADLDWLDLRWHFVGQIQSNKAGRIAAYADMVHSVDSTRLAHRLNSGAHHHDRKVDCLVQVSLDPDCERQDGRRGGVGAGDVEEVAAAVETAGGLRLRGVMGVAPLGGDAPAAYVRLREISDRLRARFPNAAVVSAGMSDDFDAAIRAGATHVRVGSAVLGQRPALG